VAFRRDTAFAKPQIHEALDERNVTPTIRIPPSLNLRSTTSLFAGPGGRPSASRSTDTAVFDIRAIGLRVLVARLTGT
jgi:hypothetical protein